MHRTLFAALAAVSLLAAPALAGQPDNLRLYSILANDAKLSIDGGQPETIGTSSVNFYYFTTGQHSFVLTDANGEQVTLNADLEDNNMSTLHGRSWWCVTTGRRSGDNQLVLMFDSKDQCDHMLAVAPAENDDPNDSDAPAAPPNRQ